MMPSCPLTHLYSLARSSLPRICPFFVSFLVRQTRGDILISELPAKKRPPSIATLTVPSSDIIFFLRRPRPRSMQGSSCSLTSPRFALKITHGGRDNECTEEKCSKASLESPCFCWNDARQ